jgi:hypothetical protein
MSASSISAFVFLHPRIHIAMSRGMLLKPGASFCSSELFGATRVIRVATRLIPVSLPTFLVLSVTLRTSRVPHKLSALSYDVDHCSYKRSLRVTSVARLAALRAAHVANAVVSPSPQDATLPSVQSDLLTVQQQEQLNSLLKEFTAQIAFSSEDLGELSQKYREFFLQIPTVEGATCKQRPYKLSYKEVDEFRRQLAVLLDRRIIRRADGPTDFISPVLFVPKPRNPSEVRMCVDFRRLNLSQSAISTLFLTFRTYIAK